ncbi:MAG: flagellar motor protein MotB [Oscillospiraceae bacterium]
MSRKHEEEEPEKENSERWLLTYSDLITLLLAFFIILYTISSMDLEKMKALSHGLSEAFKTEDSQSVQIGPGVALGEDSTADGTPTDSSSEDESSGTDSTGEAEKNKALELVFNEITEYIKANDLEDLVDVQKFGTYVKIVLRDTVLFEPDSPVMLTTSKPVLNEIEQVIAKVYDQVDLIAITGHTADVADLGDKSTDFEWDLSTNRALAVLNYMRDLGISAKKFSATGRAHFEPIASNDTADGRAQNRRVEFVITTGYTIS